MTPEERASAAIATVALAQAALVQKTMDNWADGQGELHHQQVHEAYIHGIAEAIRAECRDPELHGMITFTDDQNDNA